MQVHLSMKMQRDADTLKVRKQIIRGQEASVSCGSGLNFILGDYLNTKNK